MYINRKEYGDKSHPVIAALSYNYTVRLSPRFFCIDATLLCKNWRAIRYESTSLNRIVADKSHRVIVALHIASCLTDYFVFTLG